MFVSKSQLKNRFISFEGIVRVKFSLFTVALDVNAFELQLLLPLLVMLGKYPLLDWFGGKVKGYEEVADVAGGAVWCC